jgi:hypothetical protein
MKQSLACMGTLISRRIWKFKLIVPMSQKDMVCKKNGLWNILAKE